MKQELAISPRRADMMSQCVYFSGVLAKGRDGILSGPIAGTLRGATIVYTYIALVYRTEQEYAIEPRCADTMSTRVN